MSEYGPCFGGMQGAGFDLCIKDKCHEFEDSFCNTPKSYSMIDKKTGIEINFEFKKRFRVIEY